jgi:catechol 2,3-dioxygenase-like lactoylglutathione lyase family enzyme
MTDRAGPARRVLHVCYCCDEVDGPASTFVRGLGMRETMRTTGEPTSGAILGMDREVRGVAAFVYDHRGPRVAAAIEVQSWIDPTLVGRPFEDPHHVGVQALGFAVPDLDSAVAALEGLGSRVVGRRTSPIFDAPSAAVMDADGVRLDLVEGADAPEGHSRLRHLRITCSDLARSTQWYAGLGFNALGEPKPVTDGMTIGHAGPVTVQAQRLRLPDEPMEIVLTEWREPRSFGRHYAAPNHAGLYRIALGVDDTRSLYESMSATGWVFDRAPMLITLDGTPVPDMWITFTTDPDGVPFELVQRPREAFR